MDGVILSSKPVTVETVSRLRSSSSDCGGNVCLSLQRTHRSTGLLKAVLFKMKSPCRGDDCSYPDVSADYTALKPVDGSVDFPYLFLQLGLKSDINNHFSSDFFFLQ